VSLKVLEGSSGRVEEWLTDARVTSPSCTAHRHPAGRGDLATVDSYLIGRRDDRLTADDRVPARLDDCSFILPGAPTGCAPR
jgi:hypothetical protein